MKKLALLLIFLPTCLCFGQTDFFTNLTVGKNFKKDPWGFSAAADWKHIYDDIGWSRIGVYGSAGYSYKNWKLLGGLASQYTFDREIVNGLEIRPWLGIGLTTEIVTNLKLEQEVRLEWRNFIYHEIADENYVRTTYNIGLNYGLEKINLPSWSVQSGYIWYFLKDPAAGERYADSREFRFLITKDFSGNKLSFGYKSERFRILPSRPHSEAHTLDVTFTFK